jgi:uncharacterized protein with PIN domain
VVGKFEIQNPKFKIESCSLYDRPKKKVCFRTMTERTDGSRARPRFLCDAMLGSLARWLRFFGFDTLYPAPGPEDSVLAEKARNEDRWLLTRDHELASAGPRSLLVRAASLEDQLVEVFDRLGLRPSPSLDHARCGECNGGFEEVSREDVAGVVPPYVLATSPRFRRCKDCGRVYWPGSHGERLLERMREVIDRTGN